MTSKRIASPICEMFGIQHPIILAGMNAVAGPDLAAAVTNAGGLGVVGGVGYTPKFLRESIRELKEELNDPNAPFGIDLLLPQVGGSARKTNYDYTGGKLPELIDIIIEEGAKLFVSAVGVPPRWAVDKLHAAGIPCMNMIGSTRHVKKALAAGMDIICAQGTEGGGHTGDTATSVLIPQVCDLVKGKTSPLTGGPIHVVAAAVVDTPRGHDEAVPLRDGLFHKLAPKHLHPAFREEASIGNLRITGIPRHGVVLVDDGHHAHVHDGLDGVLQVFSAGLVDEIPSCDQELTWFDLLRREERLIQRHES